MQVANLFVVRLIEYKQTKNLNMSKLMLSSLLHPEEPALEVHHYHETLWEDDKAMDQFTDIDEMIALIKESREAYP
jgi:protein tyrosine phosphatase